ncbi:MAG: DUF4381 domain-containing protein [Gammaproteobacteria bacterium]|nr:DUF4381 domain-containing protein [Gammaproteobacteria bacterium]
MNGPELRDIHLPDGVAWWPPAPGWWLLPLLVVALALAAWWWRARRRSLSARRRALGELERIRSRLQGLDADPPERGQLALREVSALLRRILISYRGRGQHAATSGSDWVTQLRDLAAAGFSAEQFELLGRARYRRGCSCDSEALLAACEAWIRALPRESNRAAG